MCDKINEAVNAISREYQESIHDMAEEIVSDIIGGEYLTDWEEVDEHIHETVDSSEWVIYTFKAKLVLIVSGNADAFTEDELVDFSRPNVFEQMAYWAVHRDLQEELERQGVTQDALEAIEELEDTGDVEEMKRKRAAILCGEEVE